MNGYGVIAAHDGETALKIARESTPDLVLLDILMPSLNGYEVCSRLKSGKETQFIPVIMVTSLKGKEDKIKGIEAGADDFVSKPYDQDELLARVRSLLKIKSLHDRLEHNYTKLKELEKMKNNLMHMIVHDLNNPLTAISVRLEILREESKENLTEEQKSDLDTALMASEDLRRMISNLLDINKMEEGRIDLHYEKFDLNALAEEVVNQMRPLAIYENRTLSLETPNRMPEASADRELVKRVITNLVSNAIKFTSPGDKIGVKAGYNEEEKNFYVRVKDSGKPISEKHIARIFDKFIHIESDRPKTGRGLGLTFCKMAIEAHGGKIWAESKPGEGNLFIFTLPLKI